MKNEEILVCKNCGAKITKKHLEYANKNEQFPHDCNHLEECGCIKESLNWDGECDCKFVPINTWFKEVMNMKITGFLIDFDEMSALYRFMRKNRKDIPDELIELLGRLSKENCRK